MPPDPETLETLTLVRRAQAGDHPALEALFERYYGELQRMVGPMLGGGLRRFLESGDVLGEALYDAIRDFDRFDIASREAFLALMRRVVENRIRKEARYHRAGKRDREREVALRLLSESVTRGELVLGPPSAEPTPSSVVGRAEETQVLTECLASLPDRTRLVLRLRFEEERPWAEIASQAGFASEDAARMHFARAQIELRDRVRERLGRPGDGG